MPYDTPDQLWEAMSVAAREAAATGKAIPLPETFGGALVCSVDAASPLAARVLAAIAADDGTGVIPPTPPCCGNCKFWRGGGVGEEKRCQAVPPTWFVPAGTVWPMTKQSDWCGRWEALNASP